MIKPVYNVKLTNMVNSHDEYLLLKKSISEKELLLSLSADIAKIKARGELMQLIRVKFQQLFYFCHCTIALSNKEKTTLRAFLLDPNSKMRTHSDYQHLITNHYPFADGLHDKIEFSDTPEIFNLDDLVAAGKAPGYAVIMNQSGVKQLMGVALKTEGETIGVLAFYSDIAGNFNSSMFSMVSGIVGQVSLTVNNILASEAIENKIKEREALLHISDAIARVKNRDELLALVNTELKQLFIYSHSLVLRLSNDGKFMNPYILDPQSRNRQYEDYDKMATQPIPVNDGLLDKILLSGAPLVFDIEAEAQKEAAQPYMQMHFKSGLKELMAISLRTPCQEPLGILVFVSDQKGLFDNEVLSLVKGVVNHIDTALNNILHLEEIEQRNKENNILLSISHAIASLRNKDNLISVILAQLKSVMSFTDICISYYDLQKGSYTIFAYDCQLMSRYPDYDSIVTSQFPINDGIHNVLIQSENTVIFRYEQLQAMQMPHVDFMLSMDIREIACIRLVSNDQVIGALVLAADKDNSFSDTDADLIQRLSHHLSTAISNIRAHEIIGNQLYEINRYKQQLEEEKHYLLEEANIGYSYDDIIGSGPEMQKVFHLLSQVAFANSTVLLLGETGTGKELVARAIHNSSPRKDKLMVKVNCAAIPATLIESELFGHERGSFTGATERRIGKFELANKGTLFLDEIGELPLDLQVKLLRALQEKEIERVGGQIVIKTDVRIIAATNRNLFKEVEEGRFRRDLYYRLNVFPVVLPPLREHKEDIPDLALHFLEKYAKNAGKKINKIANMAMKELMAYHWPGNVRELEHLMERSVLLAKGETLKDIFLPPPIITGQNDLVRVTPFKTYEENEREYIIKALNIRLN